MYYSTSCTNTSYWQIANINGFVFFLYWSLLGVPFGVITYLSIFYLAPEHDANEVGPGTSAEVDENTKVEVGLWTSAGVDENIKTVRVQRRQARRQVTLIDHVAPMIPIAFLRII
jgi:hypothetical protein